MADVIRGGFVESRHFGMAVALDPDGRVVFATGDVDAVILPRSTAKPLQAVGCLIAGAELDAEETAIAAGSHTGEDRHVALVDRMLKSAGLDHDALGCPPDQPEDEETRHRLIAQGIKPAPIRMNCSGKHAAMLKATADPATYLSPEAPVQRTIRAEIDRLTGAPTSIVTVDGCGAPLFDSPLIGLARAFSQLAQAEPDTADRRVADAMRRYPELVGGHGHVNTEVMRSLPGVIAKGGAEGVIAMATEDGYAVAVKVIDGNPRATTLLALSLLEKCGLDTTPATHLKATPILGGGTPVGEIRPLI
ncbi:asparaginase [Kribbella amoyensis]|uniref:asparaginase n=1 Tax=Kribbella amoyensis TaxID=996641 RepID=UPI001EE22A19|nr:asparaginase [Kribbella amoyensis]